MEVNDLKSIRLLLSGGISRAFGTVLGHGHRSKYGQLALLDLGNKQLKTLIKHTTPAEYCADVLPSVCFQSASLERNRLYLCSPTQVFVYEYPSLELILEINHPYFNDLHHVARIGDVTYVASTGIDAVLGFDDNGELIEARHVMGMDLWYRRPSNIDYRKIASTKPHDSHPNFVFSIDNDIWVTRFEQKDAINLNNASEKIIIDVERPHDGHVVGSYIYFTTVNGCVVIADRVTKEVSEVIDLNAIDSRGRALGWWRGLAIIDNYAFVGFSRLRTTTIEKNLRWLKSVVGNTRTLVDALPARVALYDLTKRELLDEFNFHEEDMNTIFSIIPVTE